MEIGRTVLEEILLEILARLPLVTRVDKDGAVSSFKVIRSSCMESENMGMYEWRVNVYSFKTGTCSFKRLLSSIPLEHCFSSMNLNGMLYIWGMRLDRTGPRVLIAHDFYGPEADNQCRVIPLPLPYIEHGRRCLTTSGGDVMCIEILDRRLKVWRLKNNNNSENSEPWILSREEINMSYVDCIPMAKNPFDSKIVYLWSLEHNCLVSGNFHTKEFVVHQKSWNWSSTEGSSRINTHYTRTYMEGIRDDVSKVLMLSQFVLPRWMDSVPPMPN